MTSAADVKAGRAGVEMFMDLSELKSGMGEAQQEFKKLNDNVSKMRWGQAMNQLGVGLQDFVTVLSQGGTWATAIGAISNNVIQLATQIKPVYGGYAAVGIAAFQAAAAGYKMMTAAKQTKEELEKARREAEKLAEAQRDSAKKKGSEDAKIRSEAGDKTAMDKNLEKARADVVEKQGAANGLRELISELSSDPNKDLEREPERIKKIKAAQAELTKAVEEETKARERLEELKRIAIEAAKTPAQKAAEQELKNAELAHKLARGGFKEGQTMAQRKAEQDATEARLTAARAGVVDANRRAGYDPKATANAKAQADKDSAKEQARVTEERLEADEEEREARKRRIEEMRKELRTPSEVAADERKAAQEMYDRNEIGPDMLERKLAQIDKEYKQSMKALLPSGAQEDEDLAEDIKKNWMTPEDRKKKNREMIDRLYGKGLLSDDEQAQALRTLDDSKQSVMGTFSSAALSGLSASSPLDAIKENTAQTAEATKQLVKTTGPRKWEI